ncbi:hypothetical protein PISL3812_05441 [Talaromyces islandicus]|uniref:Uncharacterized protein n=1 Tax=Talaromyces islandicus TaxID=28573 RepID=A0A0U1M0B9_TALIS|nr:hypothetical protein PISL3812_05441 [Talaromyces islandicus]
MAPLVPVFSTDDLPDRVQFVRSGFKEKRRKGGNVDLEKCDLMEMVQYSCNPPEEGIQAPGVVKCKPIVRWRAYGRDDELGIKKDSRRVEDERNIQVGEFVNIVNSSLVMEYTGTYQL